MAGTVRTYLSAVPGDDNNGCSLSINVKKNNNNPTICQFALNNSSTLINDAIGNVGENNYQLFVFGAYSGNVFSFYSNNNGTSSISATSYNAYSDYRIKENIKTLDETYIVDNIRPIEYTIGHPSDTKQFGVIAHELAEIYPHLINGEKDCTEKMQTVNYVGLIPILINEIKALEEKVKELENQFSA